MKDKNSNIKDEDQYSCKQIANLGKSFYRVAMECSEGKNFSYLGWAHPMLVPSVINMVFSCELFMKAILKNSGKEIKTHKLTRLFNEMPKEIKKDIICSENKEDFMKKLSQISDLFVKWRYIYQYELKPFSYSFIKNLSEKLQDAILSLELN